MSSLSSRFIILGLMVTGGIALAIAQGRAEFGYLDLHATDGHDVALRGVPTDDGSLRFEGDGIEAVIGLPARAVAGTITTLHAEFRHEGRTDQGDLLLDVQEAGRMLSGTLHGVVGAWAINGGVRVRLLATDLAGRQLAARP